MSKEGKETGLVCARWSYALAVDASLVTRECAGCGFTVMVSEGGLRLVEKGAEIICDVCVLKAPGVDQKHAVDVTDPEKVMRETGIDPRGVLDMVSVGTIARLSREAREKGGES